MAKVIEFPKDTPTVAGITKEQLAASNAGSVGRTKREERLPESPSAKFASGRSQKNMNVIEKSTWVLREEHQLIGNAIEAIVGIVKELENDTVQDRRQVLEMAQSFATFVGRSHHTKEDFLLSMIRARSGCSDEFPIRSFYAEHHRVEVLLASLRKTANEYLEADAGSLERLVGSFRDVVDFYPGHMWKADHILFPLADDLLSETDQRVLVEQFAWIESAVGGSADEQLRAIAAEFHPTTTVT